jgi:N-acetylneuraminic acid mutarotase
MIKRFIMLAIAFGLFSIGAAAQAGKPCPWDDKQLPEKSKICRFGTIHQCEDGQWVSLGTRCTANFQEDRHAGLSAARRILGEPRPQRDAIVARIAPQS